MASMNRTRTRRSSAATTHLRRETFSWAQRIPAHPPRRDSATFVAARKKMNEIAQTIAGFFYGPPRYEDHHGGGLWLKDEDGWFLVRNIAGIEWSAQFCADPEKVDQLRINAKRLYARFPEAVEDLKIRKLCDTPIVDAKGVSRWTDGICNASVPLAADEHRGTLPRAGGIHHYPAPVAEIAFFKYDDFELWVTDKEGNEVAVVPVRPRGSSDGRTRALHAIPAGSFKSRESRARREKASVLGRFSRISEQAFGEQYAKLAEGSVAESDPLSRASLPQ